MADGGTIFLDEVGNIKVDLQAKLLRVIEERCFERVGGNETIYVDVRILAATNRDLEEGQKDGSFRDDLYFRLNVVKIELPPLRERLDDIPTLATYFLTKFRQQAGKRVEKISQDVLELFMNYHWPGNVRELENVVERAVVMCRGNAIERSHIKLSRSQNASPVLPNNGGRLKDLLSYSENEIIRAALEQNNWDKDKVAEVLDVSRSSRYQKIKKYGLDR